MTTPATTVSGALVAVLLGNAPVMAIATKVYPSFVPRSPGLPKITFHCYADPSDTSTGGFSNDGATGHGLAKFYVDAWAIDLLAAWQLAKAINTVLHGFKGTVGNVVIDCIQVADKREQQGSMIPGQEKPIQRVTLDVRIQYAA
jgi:hypothetical protein